MQIAIIKTRFKEPFMFITLLTLILTTSCVSFKSKSQIEKERVTQGLPVQVEQSQKLMAKMTLRMNELENRIQDYTGEIEEIEYRQQKLIPQTQKQIQDKLVNQSKEIKTLKAALEKNQEETSKLKELVESQKSYIQKVSTSLKTISKQTYRAPIAKKVKTKARAKAISRTTELQQGLKNFSKRNYTKAKSQLLSSLKNEKNNAAQKNQIFQALGHIEFKKKNYNQSSVYFSKIFSKYPKSSMAPDALLHIARAFKNQKNIDAAKEAYQTFINSYPKNKLKNQAQKELKSL